MPHADTLVLFMLAALALNVTPGPDMIYEIARSTSEGRAAGIASALGIGTGCLFHIAALAIGLCALLVRLPAAYDTVRLAGAGYLLYLGVRALASRGGVLPAGELEPARSPGAIVLQGAVTNVFSPKVALFFLAFLPQFVRADGWTPAAQVVFLGLLFNSSGTVVNLGVALAASRATGWLRANQTTAARLQRAAGVVFIGLGVRLAVERPIAPTVQRLD